MFVLSTAALLALWEMADHFWLMQEPMRLRHGLNLGVTVLLLTLTASAVFTVILRYERTLQHLNAELRAKSEALQQLEAVRDERLLELAQDLSLSLVDLTSNAQVALQRVTDLPNIQSFSAAIDRAEEMSGIASALLELKHMTAKQAADLPPIAELPTALVAAAGLAGKG